MPAGLVVPRVDAVDGAEHAEREETEEENRCEHAPIIDERYD